MHSNIDKNISELFKAENTCVNEQAFFNKQIWRISDVAEYLGVSKGHIYNLVMASKKMRRKGGIPYRKRGKLLFFIPSEILEWIDQGDQ